MSGWCWECKNLLLIYHHLPIYAMLCFKARTEMWLVMAGLNSIKKKNAVLCWSLAATARRKLAISDQIGCEPWRTAGLLAHNPCGDGSTMVTECGDYIKMNRKQHRFSDRFIWDWKWMLYIYIWYYQLCESSHPHWWEKLLWSTSLEGVDFWMVDDIGWRANHHKLNCFVVSQCFTDAFSKSSDPFIIDPWFSWVFLWVFFSKLSHQGSSFPAVWSSVPHLDILDHRIVYRRLGIFPIFQYRENSSYAALCIAMQELNLLVLYILYNSTAWIWII